MKTIMRCGWQFFAVLVVVGFGLGLTGCQTVTEPFTNRRQFILTSPSQEATMSLDAWKDILGQEKPSTNASHTAAVVRVGKAISAAAERPDFEWEFRVFASDQANAFCLPGGKVGVYEGLFEYIANDGELATVVAHEVGHAIARHGGERMTQALMVNLGAAGLALALNAQTSEARERWLAAYTGVSTIGFILPYSRKHEYAADTIGLMLMAKAGYDPEAALSFWEKFGTKKGGAAPPEFLSTHPVGAKRLEQLRSQMMKASLEYELASPRRGLGLTY